MMGLLYLCSKCSPLNGLVHLEHRQEGRLRHLDVTNLAHTLLTLLLLLQELAFTRNITTVALRSHILTHSLHRLTGDDLRTDGCLDGNIELLARDEFLELLAHLTTKIVGMSA